MSTHIALRPFASMVEEAEHIKNIDLDNLNRETWAASRAATALAIFTDRTISNERLFASAEAAITASRGQEKATFVPIFTTNHCDSECKMCGMRKSNGELVRKFSGRRAIEDQLHVLYEHEHVRGVGFLTGEYQSDYTRKANAFLVGWAIRQALDMGFRRVYFNIGSMEPDDIEVLGEWLEPSEPVTMCVFQETYNRYRYGRIMGEMDDELIPKSDYDRRLRSFDQWLDAGFTYVNPGMLVGLHTVEEDLASLCDHVEHLYKRGARLDISLPRLRPALGVSDRTRVSDDDYRRLIATVAYIFPECPIVLTTRETAEFQDSVLPMIGVISPGSPDVAPYRRDDALLVNEDNSSQFNIPDRRHPRDVLSRIVEQGYNVDRFILSQAVGDG